MAGSLVWLPQHNQKAIPIGGISLLIHPRWISSITLCIEIERSRFGDGYCEQLAFRLAHIRMDRQMGIDVSLCRVPNGIEPLLKLGCGTIRPFITQRKCWIRAAILDTRGNATQHVPRWQHLEGIDTGTVIQCDNDTEMPCCFNR